VCIREYATRVANARIGAPPVGQLVDTADANANTDAEWPDGKEVDRGMVTWRARGTSKSARSGLRRPPKGFAIELATVKVTTIAARPSRAARLPGGPVRAINAAVANQSWEWLAVLNSRWKNRSSLGGGGGRDRAVDCAIEAVDLLANSEMFGIRRIAHRRDLTGQSPAPQYEA
jgi:hypothetical protein